MSNPNAVTTFTGRIYSTDSAKADKAKGFGWLNAIMYMAPATQGGVGNLCSHASPACIAACLGWESGQASMVKHDSDLNSVRLSRIHKAQAFMRGRVAFMRRMAIETARVIRQAHALGMQPCIRPNGSQDVAWEGIAVDIDLATAKALAKLGFDIAPGRFRHIMEVFPTTQFVDYTKNGRRFDRALPDNYHLTFSRSETNEAQALALLSRGVNVAVVFSGPAPAQWHGYTVIDGDTHDLRHLDPRGPRGFVVALSPKGRKAKRDVSGFVVRLAA